MPRYVACPSAPRNPDRPRANWTDYDGLVPDIHVPEAQPVDTGLLDASGNKLMRMPNPVGFGRDREW